MLYLDVLASYPMLDEAQKVLVESCEKYFANPSASHLLGEEAKQSIENAREVIADSIDALPSEILFTSGATESNNLIIKGVVMPLLQLKKTPHIITTSIEHKCILEICAFLESLGCEVSYLQPDNMGVVSADSIKNSIQENTVLVSVMHANNELGTINNIKEIGALCFENNIKFHTDVAQSYLKKKIDVDELNIDFLSISAHKIGGPKGIGAAFIRDLRSTDLQPLLHGAGQESGLRGGTLATPLILSFSAAVTSFSKYYCFQKMDGYKKYFLNKLIDKGVNYQINGNGDTLPFMVNISLINIDVPALIREKYYKYSLSEGAACSSGSIEPSHVLSALSLSRDIAEKTLRISFPFDIQESQLTELVDDISKYKIKV